MPEQNLHVAVVGLGFGRSFVPIYQAHPNVSRVSICDPNADLVGLVGEEHRIESRFMGLPEVLADPSIDAVHLLTPVPLHVEQSLAVLCAEKHCACAVPMATSVDGLQRIIRASNKVNRTYMMMETSAYTREYLYAKDLYDRGELGNVTFLQADYFQDLEATYPQYWRSVPPMHYATHAIAPILALLDTQATEVSCLGGGRIRPDISTDPQNPFPLQTAHFRLRDTDAVAQVTRAWYQTAHAYVESFSVYGDLRGFEWAQLEHEDPVVYEMQPVQREHRWRDVTSQRVPVPYRPDLLSVELAPFADGGHGGSHPHLVHEFISSIAEGRRCKIDAVTSAAWTIAGVCAHESSLQGGAWVSIPQFDVA